MTDKNNLDDETYRLFRKDASPSPPPSCSVISLWLELQLLKRPSESPQPSLDGRQDEVWARSPSAGFVKQHHHMGLEMKFHVPPF